MRYLGKIQDPKDLVTKEYSESLAYAAYPTDSVSGSIVSFSDGADNIPVKSLTAQITPVQAGSGDPSPTNIRPISGHTGATVTRTGKNLYNPNDITLGGYINATGAIVSNNAYCYTGFIPVKPSTSYAFAQYRATVDTTVGIASYDSNKNFISRDIIIQGGAVGDISQVFTTSATAAYIRIYCGVNATNTQLEEGSAATDYAPYDGTTYTVEWTDGAGTVYGGTLDVTNGDLVNDMKSRTFADVAWELNTSVTPNYFQTAYDYPVNLSRRAELLCSKYKTLTPSGSALDDFICGFTSIGQLRVRDTRYSTVSDFVASLSDAQFVYPLATSTSTALDPVEVKTLYGDNNVWADTGDITVQYRADTSLYIQKLISNL